MPGALAASWAMGYGEMRYGIHMGEEDMVLGRSLKALYNNLIEIIPKSFLFNIKFNEIIEK